MKIIDVTVTTKDKEALKSWVPTNFRFGSWEACFYCGEEPNHFDHAIPWSFLFPYDRSEDPKRGIIVPACRSCNGRLNSFIFDTLADRCLYIKDVCLDKHHATVNKPDWTDAELRELDHSLRQYVRHKQFTRAQNAKRAAWQENETFRRMFNEAYADAMSQFPHNKGLHLFMRPPWLGQGQSIRINDLSIYDLE